MKRINGATVGLGAYAVIVLLIILGTLAFWGLVIYALYLLVTGQLHLG